MARRCVFLALGAFLWIACHDGSDDESGAGESDADSDADADLDGDSDWRDWEGGCSSSGDDLLPTGMSWQWQLLGEIDTGFDVEMYDIDLFDAPDGVIEALQAAGKFVVCYFSAGSWEEWPASGTISQCTALCSSSSRPPLCSAEKSKAKKTIWPAPARSSGPKQTTLASAQELVQEAAMTASAAAVTASAEPEPAPTNSIVGGSGFG